MWRRLREAFEDKAERPKQGAFRLLLSRGMTVFLNE
ncbi:unnamed protein product [Ixodes persulcatus]